MNNNTLWLIDDDPALRLVLEDTFVDAGLNVVAFANAKGAWAKLNDALGETPATAALPAAILTDIRMPMMDGLAFSDWVHNAFPELPIVIMTAHSDLKSAVDSYQTGAFEYLPKPFDLDDAIAVIKKAMLGSADNQTAVSAYATDDDATAKRHPSSLADSDLTSSARLTPSEQATSFNPSSQPKTVAGSLVETSIIGQSAAMQTVFRAIGRLSASPITVLITGESGTGKELVAGALHEHSPRADKSFIALNMAAIPHDLIESELFGHEKGAFTGATAARQGRFEQADGGTLFLDEIGDMPFSTQTRLLRVLANGEFFRVGGQKPVKVDVRIIAATHQNLEQLVKEGKFREDLFYRLNVIRLPLPPLRERPEDIPALVAFFMQRAASEMSTEQKQLSADAMHVMQAFDWAGNVRQLENACRWITVMATGDVVLIEDLPPELLQFMQGHVPHALAHDADFVQLSKQPNNPTSELKPVPNFHASISKHASGSSMKSHSLSAATDQTLDTTLPSQTSTWQRKLQLWANQALNQGETDILQSAIPEFERVLIEVALKHTRGRKGEAAELLGWGRNTLTRKLKQLEDNDL